MKTVSKILTRLIVLLCLASPGFAEDKDIYDVQYIREQKIADLEVPQITGRYYNDLIPDTLDIAQRAALAINVLTRITDPKVDYEIYWCTYFKHNPPFMWHDWSDWCGTKFWESLPLMRTMTGSSLNNHVDPVWYDVLLKSIGPDGLFYIPLEGRPWARLNWAWGPTVWRADGTTTHINDTSVTQISHPMPTGRVITLLTIYYQLSQDPVLKDMIEKMIDRSLELTVNKGDWGYLPLGFFEPNAKIDPDAPVPTGLPGIESYGRLIQGPALYYQLTGYEPAKVLSGKLINAVRYHGRNFDSDGRFIGDEGMEAGQGGPHFHAHTFMLMSMMDYAVPAEDEELAGFVKKSYEWARTQGNPTVGFFPEWINGKCQFSETCEVADMTALAIRLSRAGVGDYWDDADRWIRNQYSQNQLTRVDWLYPVVERLEESPVELEEIKWAGPHTSVPEGVYTDENVPMRNLGGFAGWPSANDWFNDEPGAKRGIMHCCTGNGSRTLYFIWQDMLTYDKGRLKINLLLNRASKWADVYSYVPYEGQVRIQIKEPCEEVLVRMPQWVTTGEPNVECFINEQNHKHKWERRYINIGKVKAEDTLKVSFPIVEKVLEEVIANKTYTLTIRGNTVIDIDPQGTYCPLYRRKHYRHNMPWRPVTRFAADRLFYY